MSRTYVYTKDQLLNVLEAWGVEASPPKKSERLVVAFPPPATLNLATVTRHPEKGVYGNALYTVAFTSTTDVLPGTPPEEPST
jgi:hypothetical protein